MAPYIHAHDIELYYESAGSGPTLVFLHGFQLDHTVMKFLGDPLKEDFRVVVVDLPGHGRSGKPLRKASYESMVIEIKAFLDHLSIERAVFIGYSMGGQLTLKFAALYPERVNAMVLIGTGFKYGENCRLVCRSGKNEDMIRRVKEVKEKYEKAISCKKDLVPDHVKESISAELISFDFSHEAEKVQGIPILIVAGEIDKYYPEDIQRSMFAAFEKAELRILSDCGHGLIFEKTDECLDHITQFLAGMSL